MLFKFVGIAPNDNTGVSVSSAGDVDGDGLADLVIAADWADGVGINSGHVFIVTAADLPAIDLADGTADGIISVANIAGTGDSFQFVGGARGDKTGRSVSFAGDVDGDGLGDVLISAHHADGGGAESGEAYLLTAADFANVDAADGTVDGIGELLRVPGIGGYRFLGDGIQDYAGHSVSSAGDIDGDGLDDLLIGADRADADGVTSGEAYLMMASDLADLDAADGTADGLIDLSLVAGFDGAYHFISGAASDTPGRSASQEVNIIGDVDGDGRSDFIIGAPKADTGGTDSGEAYLVTAQDLEAADLADGLADGLVDLRLIAGLESTSYQFTGADAGDLTGIAVSSAGDVDGDGKDDMLIGATQPLTGTGVAYLVTAADLAALDAVDTVTDRVIDLGEIAGTGSAYRFVGRGSGDEAGYAVSSAGDVDGDGLDDLLIGARYADEGAANSGETYLISGADLAAVDLADGLADGNVDLAEIAGIGGSYRLVGGNERDRVGTAVAAAGDVDGDGTDDLLIGASQWNGGNGETYLIGGESLSVADAQDGTWDGVIDLGLLAGGALETESRETGDGRLLETTFLNGTRAVSDMTDVADSRGWETFVVHYDATGQRVHRAVTYDDGREQEIIYTDGMRSSVTLTDSADVHGWLQTVETFDFTGTRNGFSREYDDGRLLELAFDAEGVRTTSTMTDVADVFGWESRVLTFDETGSTAISRLTVRDDGTEIFEDLTII